MSLELIINGNPVDVKIQTFSGGEVQVRIADNRYQNGNHAIIKANINSATMLMTVLLTTDAVRRMFKYAKLHLICPYLPYARQDRVCYIGEALSVKVLANIINAQHYESVEIWDAHSDVSLALMNNVVHKSAHKFVSSMPDDVMSNCVIVAPDKGAVKRAAECARASLVPYTTADKVRNPDTGEITDTVVNCNHIGNKDFLMVDDICDGGRTFIELAKKLRPLTNGKVFLYVTHAILSQDIYVLRGDIDHIYTANLFEPYASRYAMNWPADATALRDFVTVL